MSENLIQAMNRCTGMSARERSEIEALNKLADVERQESRCPTCGVDMVYFGCFCDDERLALPCDHRCHKGCKLSPDPTVLHPQCKERDDCHLDPGKYTGRTFDMAWCQETVVMFNAWPQCEMRRSCNDAKACIGHCSVVTGAVLQDGRCPYDDWKPSRDI